MPKRLTKSEYKEIKNLLHTMPPQAVHGMSDVNKGISTIRQIQHSKNFEDYKERYYKNYKSPSLWDKIKKWWTLP